MKKLQLQCAVDVNFAKTRFPLMGFRKVDGVRAGHITGGLTGRSLDPFNNSAVVAKFADPVYQGFDGEITLRGYLKDNDVPVELAPDGETLCGLTTGIMNRSKLRKGEIELPSNVVWNLFDYLDDSIVGEMYHDRYVALQGHLNRNQPTNVHLLPFKWIEDAKQAQDWIDECLFLQFEGAIFRCPTAMHKSGRATETLNDFWRYKPTSDKDAIVLSVEEAQANNNEAKTNSRGRTERSSHKENKVGNGMIGPMICRDCISGETIRVGPGAMPHEFRIRAFKDQTLIVGHPIKYTSLDTGVKDAPRQARFKCLRPHADLAIA